VDCSVGEGFLAVYRRRGTPLVEANRMGCDVVGFDINPMAYWVVKQEIEHLDLRAYQNAAKALCED